MTRHTTSALLAIGLLLTAATSQADTLKQFSMTLSSSSPLKNIMFMYAAHPLPTEGATYDIRFKKLGDLSFEGGTERTLGFSLLVPDLPESYTYTYALAAIYDDAADGIVVGTSKEEATGWVNETKSFSDIFGYDETSTTSYLRNASDGFDYSLFRVFEDRRYALEGSSSSLVSFSTAQEIGSWSVKAVPEPASLIAVGLGFFGLLARRSKKS